LLAGGKLVGTVFASTPDEEVSEGQKERIMTFANQAAIAIENARLHEQVLLDTAQLEQRVAEHTRDLATLYDVTAVASQPLELQVMLGRALEQVLVAMESDIGTIHLKDEVDGASRGKTLSLAAQQGIPPHLEAQLHSLPNGGLINWILKHSEPVVVPHLARDARATQTIGASGFNQYLGAPMRAGGQTLGVISVFTEIEQQFGAEDVALLASVADHLGVAVERAWLHRRAEQAAVMEERQRLARELHDSVTQSLYSLPLYAEAAQEWTVTGDLDRVQSHLALIGETALQALKEMRLLIYELRPDMLQEAGLVDALQQRLDAVEGRAAVETHLLVGEDLKLPNPLAEGLYRIAQEALNNALKHAAAGSVTVRIGTKGQLVELEVTDNGKGFDPNAVSDRGGMGLISMRQRAEKMGGSLDIFSEPGHGSKIVVSVVLGRITG
jgi:signal transduction histidine kinase